MTQHIHSWVYISKRNNSTNSKRYMNPMLIAALLITVKIQKQPKCPSTDEWIKMSHTHTMEYYSAIKRMKYCVISMKY